MGGGGQKLCQDSSENVQITIVTKINTGRKNCF